MLFKVLLYSFLFLTNWVSPRNIYLVNKHELLKDMSRIKPNPIDLSKP